MADINGINVAAAVVPYTTDDTYATHFAAYGNGGFRSVTSFAQRNNIPSDRLEIGMIVNLIDYPIVGKSTWYTLISIPTGVATDANWKEVLLGGATYTLPPGSVNVLGGVKQGANVAIATDGTISVVGFNNAPAYTLPPASNSSLGGVKISTGTNGSLVSMQVATDGTLSLVPLAGTTTQLGLTKLYSAQGTNTDGSLTQAAETAALALKADASDFIYVPVPQSRTNFASYGVSTLGWIFGLGSANNIIRSGVSGFAMGTNCIGNMVMPQTSNIIFGNSVVDCLVGTGCSNISFGNNCSRVKVFSTVGFSGPLFNVPIGTSDATFINGVLQVTSGIMATNNSLGTVKGGGNVNINADGSMTATAAPAATAFISITGQPTDNDNLRLALGLKVDKVTGLALSSNDYTSTEKAKLAALATVATTGSYNDLLNKPTIPASGSDRSFGSWNPNLNINSTDGNGLDETFVYPAGYYLRVSEDGITKTAAVNSFGASNTVNVNLTSAIQVGPGISVSGTGIPTGIRIFQSTNSNTITLNAPVSLVAGTVLTFTPLFATFSKFITGDILIYVENKWRLRPGLARVDANVSTTQTSVQATNNSLGTVKGGGNVNINADGSMTATAAAAAATFSSITGQPTENNNLGLALGLKVDKAAGLALSSNDYTSTEKAKLASLTVAAPLYTGPGIKEDGAMTQRATTDALSTRFNNRGAWVANTLYQPNDAINFNGGTYYRTGAAFTSGADFLASNWTSFGPPLYSFVGPFTDGPMTAAATQAALANKTYYTDALARSAVMPAFTSGTHTGISFAYNSVTNKISAIVASQIPYLLPYVAFGADFSISNSYAGSLFGSESNTPAQCFINPDTAAAALVFPLNAYVQIQKTGTGNVTIVGAVDGANPAPSITVAPGSSLVLTQVNERRTLYKTGPNQWLVLGIAAANSGTYTAGTGIAISASNVISSTTSGVTQTYVDSADANIQTQVTSNTNNLALKAPLSNPTFTGVASATTAAADTNTTQLATTSYVYNGLLNKVNKPFNNQTLFGYNAGGINNIPYLNADGLTFIGSSSGLNNTTNNQTFVGVGSGRLTTGGPNNTFVGAYAGEHNTGGANNVAIGFFSARLGALGYGNTIVGSTSGQSVTGNGNTFFGFQSGSNNGSGNNNVAIGNSSGPASAALENTVSIGTNAQASTSNTLFVSDSLNAGFGVAAPTSKLAVNGLIESVGLNGGFKFPDGTTQYSAASGNGAPATFLTIGGNASDNTSLNLALTSRFNNKGTWVANTVYQLNDAVTYNGSVYYRAANATSSDATFISSNWMQFSNGVTQADLNALRNSITPFLATKVNTEIPFVASDLLQTVSVGDSILLNSAGTYDLALPFSLGLYGFRVSNSVASVTIYFANGATMDGAATLTMKGGDWRIMRAAAGLSNETVFAGSLPNSSSSGAFATVNTAGVIKIGNGLTVTNDGTTSTILYPATGAAIDGAMTQQATTAALNTRLVNRGLWATGNTYKPNDVIYHNGFTYYNPSSNDISDSIFVQFNWNPLGLNEYDLTYLIGKAFRLRSNISFLTETTVPQVPNTLGQSFTAFGNNSYFFSMGGEMTMNLGSDNGTNGQFIGYGPNGYMVSVRLKKFNTSPLLIKTTGSNYIKNFIIAPGETVVFANVDPNIGNQGTSGSFGLGSVGWAIVSRSGEAALMVIQPAAFTGIVTVDFLSPITSTLETYGNLVYNPSLNINSGSNLDPVLTTQEHYITNKSSTDITLSFPNGWTFFPGPAPTILAAGKQAILTVRSLGYSDATVKAKWVAQA